MNCLYNRNLYMYHNRLSYVKCLYIQCIQNYRTFCNQQHILFLILNLKIYYIWLIKFNIFSIIKIYLYIHIFLLLSNLPINYHNIFPSNYKDHFNLIKEENDTQNKYQAQFHNFYIKNYILYIKKSTILLVYIFN